MFFFFSVLHRLILCNRPTIYLNNDIIKTKGIIYAIKSLYQVLCQGSTLIIAHLPGASKKWGGASKTWGPLRLGKWKYFRFAIWISGVSFCFITWMSLMFRASRFCIRASKTGEALARWSSGSKTLMLSPVCKTTHLSTPWLLLVVVSGWSTRAQTFKHTWLSFRVRTLLQRFGAFNCHATPRFSTHLDMFSIAVM